MDIRTHKTIDATLCGTPLLLIDGYATVGLEVGARMAADVMGLVHGGFVFGLADYAAMLAVNEPNVVLVSAEVKFLKPVQPGDVLRADARVATREPPRYTVRCAVARNGEPVFEGTFECYVPARHVLDRDRA